MLFFLFRPLFCSLFSLNIVILNFSPLPPFSLILSFLIHFNFIQYFLLPSRFVFSIFFPLMLNTHIRLFFFFLLLLCAFFLWSPSFHYFFVISNFLFHFTITQVLSFISLTLFPPISHPTYTSLIHILIPFIHMYLTLYELVFLATQFPSLWTLHPPSLSSSLKHISLFTFLYNVELPLPYSFEHAYGGEVYISGSLFKGAFVLLPTSFFLLPSLFHLYLPLIVSAWKAMLRFWYWEHHSSRN